VFGSAIKRVLFKPIPVATAFIVGAFVILWVERSHRVTAAVARVEEVEQLTPLDALKLGLAQAFALVPGTSRSGATIIGGMLFGLSRKAATEFSFFLAIPTLIGAGVYDTYKYRALLSWADLPLFSVGLLTAFVSALACVHWLLWFVATHDFVPFAWYRIVFGAVVLVTALLGVIDWAG
jgi:undecaprenyl-diphosphatase